MKAVVCTKYGPPEVLELTNVEKPTPKNDEVLIAIHATAVMSGDCRMRDLDLTDVPLLARTLARLYLGWRRPRRPILGICLAGEIEAAGAAVQRFKAGDQVYADTAASMRFGAYAEYACLPERSLMAKKPPRVTYEETVAIPFGGLSALHFLRKARVGSGQKVLIHGASGAVGTAATQLATHLGAQVTGVCSTGSIELTRSLGAEDVIDYTREDFTARGPIFDVVVDAAGKTSRAAARKVLRPNGRYVSVVTSGHAKPRIEDLVILFELVEAGRFRAVIDRRYPLERIVEAHRYVDQGHKKGNVVVTVAP